MVVRGQSPIVKDFELVVKVSSPLSCAPSFPVPYSHSLTALCTWERAMSFRMGCDELSIKLKSPRYHQQGVQRPAGISFNIRIPNHITAQRKVITLLL
jgi:hypothetical protein